MPSGYPRSGKRAPQKNTFRKRGDPSCAPRYVAEHQELVEAIRAVWNHRGTEAQRTMVNEWVNRKVREGLDLTGIDERSA